MLREILISERREKKVVYTPEVCIGCGICSQICPKDAISLGMVGAVARGVIDELPIHINQEECTACGLCMRVCPFGALTMIVQGKKEVADTYIKYGTKETTVDMRSCKYCGLCAETCPVDAISVERRISEDGSLTFTGKVEIDGTKCIHCGWCSMVCPTNSITVHKPFAGIFELYIERCRGCGTCIEACPCNALFMPKGKFGKFADVIKHRLDACIFCGACANACPNDAIKVQRTAIVETIEKKGALEKKILQELEFSPTKAIINTYPERCHGCGNCVVACPINSLSGENMTIEVENGTVCVINQENCRGCGTCIDACPVGAIELEGVK
ncbi:MAG: 4Fe-4S binding protein [Halobacteriota archaeon]